MACQEVAYNDNYLLHLFPKSLGGTTVEWFYKIPCGTITTFVELSEKFIAQYAHNVENELTLLDLCNSKQKEGESLADYLQQWQNLTTRLSYQPPEKHLTKIFINNLHPKLYHFMRMNCIQTYQDIKSKWINIERGLLDEGAIRHHKDDSHNKSSNDKPCYWNHNKNVVTDGTIDTKHIQIIVAGPTPIPSYQQQPQTHQQPMQQY